MGLKSSIDLCKLMPALDFVAAEISKSVSADYGQNISFVPFGLHFSSDHSQTALKPGHFSIERRAETPFGNNIYFSQAPIDTEKHIEIVQRLDSQFNS